MSGKNRLSPSQTELLFLLYDFGPVLVSDLRKRFSRNLPRIVAALRRKGFEIVEDSRFYPEVTLDIE